MSVRIWAVVAVMAATTACTFEPSGTSAAAESDAGSPGAGGELGPDEPGSPDAAVTDPQPGADASPSPDACESSCPGDCNADGACVIACGNGECGQEIVCPAGIPCLISCAADGTCSNGIDCSAASSCSVTCGGDRSCRGGIECSDGPCDVQCTGQDTCRDGVQCDGSCSCSVDCDGEGSCENDSSCPSMCSADDGGCRTSGGPCNTTCD